MTIRIKRVYEAAAADDGYRILVDRLWPRGMTKEKAHVGKWMKEVAPSAGLRKWFNHEPAKWLQFRRKYHAELKGSSAFEELLGEIKRHKTITLLYGAKDEAHNDAVALREFIGEQAG